MPGADPGSMVSLLLHTSGGLALLAGGLAWVAWALLERWRAGTPPWRDGLPRVMVDAGPYRYGRQPVWLGLSAAWAGVALALHSLPLTPLLLAADALALLAAARWWVPRQEAVLARRFGGWWRDYAAEVPRWW